MFWILVASLAATFLAGAEQVPTASDVSRFVGTWIGDRTANDKSWQAGLIPMEFGLRISIASDRLIVALLDKRPPVSPGDPWTQGDTSSYQLGGSLTSTSYNAVPARSTLTKDGDVLVLRILPVLARPGGGGAGPQPPASEQVLRVLRMSLLRDRLKVDWNAGRFSATLYFDRETPRTAR